MSIILELKNIYIEGNHRHRLKKINLSINAGDKVALLGSSGAGKSTLISVANGTLTPNRGIVALNGESLKLISGRKRQCVATLWQDLRLIEQLNVIQNINAGALGRHNYFWALANLLGDLEKDRCLECMNASGLNKEFLRTPVNQLSGGQRQRVALARMLRQEAELILADEPFSNLDPKLVNLMLRMLLVKNEYSSIYVPETILMSLHRPDLLKHFTRVIGIIKGEIVIDQTSKGLEPSDLEWLYNEE